jgi:hypothetical protein
VLDNSLMRAVVEKPEIIPSVFIVIEHPLD